MQNGDTNPAPSRSAASGLRFLAPLALVVVAVALVVVVSGSLGTDDGDEGSAETTRTGDGGTQREKPPKTYTVQPGDSLLGIAEQFEIPVERVEKLNDGVDPNALSTGQELQLRR